MAKKSIVLSSGDGRVTFTNTSSVWLDDTDYSLNVTNLTASSLAIESLPAGSKLLKISGSTFVTMSNGSTHNGALLWHGSDWVASTASFGQFSGSVGGDLSGSFPNPYVINISNVNTGTLPIARGGTGLSTPSANDTIFKVSGSTYQAISVTADYAGMMLSSVNNKWQLSHPSNLMDVRYYKVAAGTASGSQSTYTWTKPAGATYARIICQGAGGGGSSGHVYQNGIHFGVGGGSGGFSDKVLDLNFISDTVTVSVGAGGLGGVGNPSTGDINLLLGAATDSAWSNGGAGGNSSFGAYVIAYGSSGTASPYGAGGVGGAGTTFNGVDGGSAGGFSNTTANGNPNTNASSGGSKGNAAGGVVTLVGINSYSRNFGHGCDSSGNIIDAAFGVGASGVTWNGLLTPKPSKPTFGAGGAGGTGLSNIGHGSGGDGGDGFVIVISW